MGNAFTIAGVERQCEKIHFSVVFSFPTIFISQVSNKIPEYIFFLSRNRIQKKMFICGDGSGKWVNNFHFEKRKEMVWMYSSCCENNFKAEGFKHSRHKEQKLNIQYIRDRKHPIIPGCFFFLYCHFLDILLSPVLAVSSSSLLIRPSGYDWINSFK